MPDPELPPRQSPATPPSEASLKSPEDFVLLVVSLRKFSMGRMVITANAQSALSPEDVSLALARHSQCDWGDVCAEDAKVNERGILDEGMILSSYQSSKGVNFWVITDPGHQITTVLLPEDY